MIAINANNPPIAAPAAAPADSPEEELVGASADFPLVTGDEPIASDWFLLAVVVGVVSETPLGFEVLVLVVDVLVVDVLVVVVDVLVDLTGPSATIFLKATAIQTLIWFPRAVQTSYCLLQHQAI